MARRLRVGLRGLHALLAAHALNLEHFHEPGNLISPNTNACASRRFPELTNPINGVVRVPEFKKLRHDLSVSSLPSRLWPAVRGVIRGWGHLQYTADELDPKTTASNNVVLVRVDEDH